MQEHELVEYMGMLQQAELDGDRAEIVVGPWTAIIMIGALQLATRHPALSPNQKRDMQAVIDQLARPFAGTPGEQIVGMGNDPTYDQEV